MHLSNRQVWLILAGLSLLTPLVHAYDHELFFAINGWHKEWLGQPMLLFTSLVDGFFVLIISALLYPFHRHKLLILIVAFALMGASVQWVKHLTDMPRPIWVFGEENIAVLGLPHTARSFPSGHSAGAFLLVRYLMDGLRARWQWLLLLLGLLAAISRAYIGVHFPIDIWVGSIYGFAIAHLFLGHLHGRWSFYMKSPEIGVNLWGLLVTLTYIFFYMEKTEELAFLLDPIAWLAAAWFLLAFCRAIHARILDSALSSQVR